MKITELTKEHNMVTKWIKIYEDLPDPETKLRIYQDPMDKTTIQLQINNDGIFSNRDVGIEFQAQVVRFINFMTPEEKQKDNSLVMIDEWFQILTGSLEGKQELYTWFTNDPVIFKSEPTEPYLELRKMQKDLDKILIAKIEVLSDQFNYEGIE